MAVAVVDGGGVGGEEDVADVASVEIDLFCFDDEDFSAGEVTEDGARGGSTFRRAGFGSVDTRETDAATGPCLETEIDVEIESVAVDEARVACPVEVARGGGPFEGEFLDFTPGVEIGADGCLEIADRPDMRLGPFLIERALLFGAQGRNEPVVGPGERPFRWGAVRAVEEDGLLKKARGDAKIQSDFTKDTVVVAGFFTQTLSDEALTQRPIAGDFFSRGGALSGFENGGQVGFEPLEGFFGEGWTHGAAGDLGRGGASQVETHKALTSRTQCSRCGQVWGSGGPGIRGVGEVNGVHLEVFSELDKDRVLPIWGVDDWRK